MPSAITPKQIATILIVNHDSSARERLRSSFEKAGYRAVVAEDAPSALRLLHEDASDLIVLDLEMPGVDGLALCRLLRAQPATSQLPVIALSAHDEDSQKVEAFAAGADDYISKASSS
ncbi:MAG: response regulator, partial [bacterium]